MKSLVKINGIDTSEGSASLPLNNRGYLYGDSIFEVFVAFHGQIIDMQPHINRLRFSAEKTAIPVPWNDEFLRFELNDIAQKMKVPKAYIRMTITRGEHEGLSYKDDLPPHRVIYAKEVKPPNDFMTKQEVKLNLKHDNKTIRDPLPKVAHYLPSILALHQAQKLGYDDILWCNSEGEITESSVANIFFIGRHGDSLEISTPSVHSGLLEGITRSRILKLLKSAKIPVQEKIIFSDEIARFDEAFLTSSIKGLVPISQIGDHILHSTRESATFHHINRLFHTWLESLLGIKVNWATGEEVSIVTHS